MISFYFLILIHQKLYPVNNKIILTTMNIEYFIPFFRIWYLYDAKLYICY